MRTVVRKYDSSSYPIRVRRAGTVEWRTFNTQNCAIREFPELNKNVLRARLSPRGFEARRLMSAADARKLGWRKAIDIRRVGDRAWRRFESVKSAAKSEDFAVGIKALQDILSGRGSTSAKRYEVRYSELQELRTVEVRHNGGAWRASARNPTARFRESGAPENASKFSTGRRQNRACFPRFLDRLSSLPEFSATGEKVS